jgi:hypothetical protein
MTIIIIRHDDSTCCNSDICIFVVQRSTFNVQAPSLDSDDGIPSEVPVHVHVTFLAPDAHLRRYLLINLARRKNGHNGRDRVAHPHC